MHTDKEGYLLNLDEWSEEVAACLASTADIELTQAHWEVIWALREFYQKTELSPAMRPFVKLIATQLGTEKGKSIYLMQLFGSSPAKMAAKISGLPRPTNCL